MPILLVDADTIATDFAVCHGGYRGQP